MLPTMMAKEARGLSSYYLLHVRFSQPYDAALWWHDGALYFRKLAIDNSEDLCVKLQAIVECYSYCANTPTMAAPEVHHLFHHPIADHSFSADRQTLAVARDNNVELYSRSGNKFVLQDELKGHDKTVTSVDIAPSTGRIVTCSQGTFLLLCSN